jgi:hypothetical protein
MGAGVVRWRGVAVVVVVLALVASVEAWIGVVPSRAAAVPNVQAAGVPAVTSPNGPVSSLPRDPNGLQLACGDDGDCTAVGIETVYNAQGDATGNNDVGFSESNGTWSSGEVLATDQRDPLDKTSLGSPGCADNGPCFGVGYVGCANYVYQTSDACPANYENALVEAEAGGAWTPSQITGDDSQLVATGVACSSSADCTVIGNLDGCPPEDASLLGGCNGGGDGWLAQGSAADLGAAQPMDDGVPSQLSEVTCARDGLCAALGDAATVTSGIPDYDASIVLVKKPGGTWSSPMQIPVPTGSSGSLPIFSVACTTTACYATGIYGDNANNTVLVIEKSTGGPWTPDYQGVTDSSTRDISCPASGPCIALGLTNATGSWQPLIAAPGTTPPANLDFTCTASGPCYASSGTIVYEESYGVVREAETVSAPADCSDATSGTGVCEQLDVVIAACATSTCTTKAAYSSAADRPEYAFATVSGSPVNLAATHTAVACTPNPIAPGRSSTCTATVTEGTTPPAAGTPSPTGTVGLSSTGTGSFPTPAQCTLQPAGDGTAICAIAYTPTADGPATIRALYSGDGTLASSNGTTTLTATPDITTTSVDCAPDTLAIGASSTCTTTVTDTTADGDTPTGSASLSSSTAAGTLGANSCQLAATTATAASCTSTLSFATAGSATVTGSYGGDSTHAGSQGSSDPVTATGPSGTPDGLGSAPPNGSSGAGDTPSSSPGTGGTGGPGPDTRTLPAVGSPSRKSRFSVSDKVTCPAGANACTITETLTAGETIQNGKVIAAQATRKLHKVKRTVVVGRVTATIPAGQTKTVTVALNVTGKRLLNRFGKLKVMLKSTQGTQALSTHPVTLTVSRSRRAQRPRQSN